MPSGKTGRLELARTIISSRDELTRGIGWNPGVKSAEEGGCGVTGFCCSIKVPGRHIIEASRQMHNRGNGKGGGIAALGLDAETLGVSQQILKDDYLLQVAFLDPGCRAALEQKYIRPCFDIDHARVLDPVADYRDIEGLEVRPPDVSQYFVRVKPALLEEFIRANGFPDDSPRVAEDEFVYQNSARLNHEFYAGHTQRAFVLGHGRNLMVLKIVGYAEQVVQYYRLEDFTAHAWIAHQRYPTKGRVWHPGGAHPFIGLNEALVHNGDFANYHSVAEYLRQRNVSTLFMTDTEVSALLFDLLTRTYGYPLEYVIEALAPTDELGLEMLPEEKRRIYSLIQSTHIHGSPDGPWFFIIARNDTANDQLQLLGITDTAMLRPQVFALMDGEVRVGLVCSEKQAIDATLKSLADDDPRFGRVADRYWNARGGSHTDGGAFIFNLKPGDNGQAELTCTDKFGQRIDIPTDQVPCPHPRPKPSMSGGADLTPIFEELLQKGATGELFQQIASDLARPGYARFLYAVEWLKAAGESSDDARSHVLETLTRLLDRRYDTFDKRRRSLVEVAGLAIDEVLSSVPLIGQGDGSRFARVDYDRRRDLRPPSGAQEILVIDASGFPPEGDDCDARLQVEAYALGWRRFICYSYRGQRFTANGLGAQTEGVRFDVYGSSGDYLASGMDGLEIHVHGNAQDQLAQILKKGKLVIHGDVGQTFMYGAKGGDVFVLGNAAGRPMINAAGRPRVVINGTCLDYLAESFMAGDPLNGGGFIVLNGMTHDGHGRLMELPTPYPGSNLFSLASGGAIYIRDPHGKIMDAQLNGGVLQRLTPEDWACIRPYLEENERLFGISLHGELLMVDGEPKAPDQVYRKVAVVQKSVRAAARASVLDEKIRA